MHTRFSSLILGLTLLTTSQCGVAFASAFDDFTQPITFVNQQRTIYVAVAANEPERERGLMFRQELAENQGMLFINPDIARRGIWMKNTLLALDVLFLSGDGNIVSMLKDLPPCRKDPCRIYDSKLPARYMLELPAGSIAKYLINVGQTVSLPR